MSAIERENPTAEHGPLFVIAGSHASLHWCVTILLILLPFIKVELGLDYTQTGLLVTILQLAAFVANIPSGIIVDVTGRRTACKLFSLTICGLGLAGLGWVELARWATLRWDGGGQVGYTQAGVHAGGAQAGRWCRDVQVSAGPPVRRFSPPRTW